MDELEIGGKRYLSSRRAAKEHRYHIDYIGQLIRAGRVTGKKVGRSWYVEENSLNTYLKQEAGAMGHAAPIVAVLETETTADEVAETHTAPEAVSLVEEQAVFAENNEVSKMTAVELSAPQVPEVVEEAQPAPMPAPVQTPVVLNQHSRDQKVNLTIAEKKPAPLTYVEDTEPLLPTLEYKTPRNADFVPVIVRKTVRVVETEPTVAELEQDEEEEEPETEQKASDKRFSLGSAIALVAIGLFVLAGAFGVSSILGTSVNIVEGKPASVSFTIK